MKKIKNLLILAVTSLALIFNLAPNLAYAQNPAKGAIQCGVNAGAGQTGCAPDPNATSSLNTTISRVINILSIVVGIVAVIMLIYGGFRYITSAGDTTRVASAKNTILYALIGLIIVALAQVIVRFVLKNVT
ncbi:MAG TPA: pilin [Candidatus Saccharimonadales bacterium]